MSLPEFFKVVRSNAPGIAALGLTWLIFFSRTLIGRYIYFLDDLKIIYYPLEVAYAAAQRAWLLPLWNPYFGFGQPLLGWGQLGFFTPVHVLLRALSVPPLILLQVSILVYFLLGLIGMYALLRRHRLLPAASALGALVYAFGGFSVGHLNHVNFYTGTLVLPWLLLSLHFFAARPSLRRTAFVALLAGAIALSAQPQVVLLCFIIAALYALVISFGRLKREPKRWRYAAVSLSLLALSGAAAVGLSSFALLPLAEFLPLTERNADLSLDDLFDFSYPPYHAVTLVAPYFFGGHDNYWGPKGFQELAAYTGILPLLFSGAALARWRRNRSLRLSAIILIAASVALALGKYSPVYSALVNAHIITSISVPGRFVFFFVTGTAFLAALGFDDIARGLRTRSELKRTAAGALFWLVLLLSPFAWQTARDPALALSFKDFITRFDFSLILLASGIAAFLAALLFNNPVRKKIAVYASLTVAAATLLIFGWSYNPVVRPGFAQLDTPLTRALADFAIRTGRPARLYSREHLLYSRQPKKLISLPPIAADFSVYQPLTLQYPTPCFAFPLHAGRDSSAPLIISLHRGLIDPPLESVSLPAGQVNSQNDQHICFKGRFNPGKKYVLSFSSPGSSGINLFATAADEPSVYLSRLEHPSESQLQASQKKEQLAIRESLPAAIDPDNLLLSRHLQSAQNISGARWIGALSIRPYREFIEQFFANDRDNPVDGEGQHVLQRYRSLFDLAGVTHFIQRLEPGDTDLMPQNGFRQIEEITDGGFTYRLYENPAAYPQTFLVPNGTFIAADDEARYAIMQPDFNPRALVAVSGPNPPPTDTLNTTLTPAGTAAITRYEPTHIDIAVDSPQNNWLVLTDSTTPQWRVFVDGEPANYFVADTIFKTVPVPAGKHTVTFIHKSDAVLKATKLTLAGLVIIAALIIIPWLSRLFPNNNG